MLCQSLFLARHPVLVGVALSCLATVAQAEDGLRFSVGLFGAAVTSPFEADKTDAGVLPDFLIEGERFSFGTSGLAYDVLERDGFTLSARLAPRFVMADPADVAGLSALKREIAVEAGLAAGMSLGRFELGLEALHDVSDTHDGTAVTASVGTHLPLSERFGIGVQLGATWMDTKLATYSYGVLPAEAGGGLAAYAVKASVIPSIGIEASYAVGEKTTLIGGVSAEFLPDSVTDSPIVKRDTVVSAMIGLRHAF